MVQGLLLAAEHSHVKERAREENEHDNHATAVLTFSSSLLIFAASFGDLLITCPPRKNTGENNKKKKTAPKPVKL